MGTKTRKKKQRKGADLYTQAQRHFEKGNLRQALKDAKQCHRQQPTDEHRSLLEHVYIARARGLSQSGLRDEARSVLKDLLELGATEPAVQAGIDELLVGLGMFDQASSNGLQAGDNAPSDIDDQLAASIADHAVLRPDESPAGMAEVRTGAIAVRAALEALYRGEEQAALEAVKSFPRSSPFADWKLFIRGLAAYYRQDTAEAAACWDRLMPERFAARIASPLQALAQSSTNTYYDGKTKSAIASVARQVSDSPVLTTLTKMRSDLASGRLDKVMKSLATSKKKLSAFDVDLPSRIAETVYQEILQRGEERHLTKLIRITDPPKLDPNWNRARALLAERIEDDVDETANYWKQYARDLLRLEGLDEPQRELATAMVWERIGAGYGAEAARHSKTCSDPDCDYADHLFEQAVEYFEKSLKAEPSLVAVYESLHLIHRELGDEDDAAQTFRRLLQHKPDHEEALSYLVQYCTRNDDPLAARDYALQAHRSKPLDRSLAMVASAHHAGCARHFAKEKKFEEGRAEFLAAEKLNPDCREQFSYCARRAIFEYVAGNLDAARDFEQQARQTLSEPTPALLSLAIESVGYGLSKKSSDDYYEVEFKKALKKKCNSETAGWLAQIVHSYSAVGIEYRGRGLHMDLVMGYLNRCKRVKWRTEDLCHVCQFLRSKEAPEADALKHSMAKKGIKKFPQEGLFHLVAAECELDKGHDFADLEFARDELQKALDLAKSSTNPWDKEVTETARTCITMVEQLSSRYGYGFDDDEYDDQYDDEYDDGPVAPPIGLFPDIDPKNPEEALAAIIDMFDGMGMDGAEEFERMARNNGYSNQEMAELKKVIAKIKKRKKKRGWF